MNGLMINDNIKIENMIYEIRGNQVMLASDIAILYHSETKVINQVVKRNIERFPETFCFKLTENEYESLRSQIVTSKETRGGNRYLPYVFTEHGIIMLSGLLKSNIAIEVNVKIINAFVSMRHYLNDNKDIYKSLNHINNKLIEYDNNFSYLFSKFDKKERLYLSNKEYDVYSDIKEIFNESKEELIVIDNYVDKTFLDLIRNINSKVILITKTNSKLTKLDIEKYNRQYKNLDVYYTNKFHDRYFIIDRKIIYHCGSSINYAGSRVFSINKLEDEIVKEHLLKYISKLIEI